MSDSPEHLQAPNRRRRLCVQYDAHGQLGAPFDEWLAFRFAYCDQPGSQIDSLTWDVGWGSWAAYPSRVLPRFEHPGLKVWWDQGIDWVAELVAATRARGLECLWNHRVSEVDINPLPDLRRPTELMLDHLNPVKAAHPDWVVKTWWWQGLWNYAVPALREYQLSILGELAAAYDLDGFQVDFARHIPCLPVGRQWETREGVTQFLRDLRDLLARQAARRGRPYLLATRIPQTLAGCRADGLDVATWLDEGLVDILTLGTRSMAVDLAGFRELIGCCPVKLQPCFDDHHATDGYRFQSIEFLRGVFANWWQQGADSVLTFNWGNADPELAEEMLQRRWQLGSFNEAPATHGQAYREVGEVATLQGRDKVFAVERRGGYPWAEGFYNRNDEALLPLPLRHDGTPTVLTVAVSDEPPEPCGMPAGSSGVPAGPSGVARSVFRPCSESEGGPAGAAGHGRKTDGATRGEGVLSVRAVLHGARPGDEFALTCNGRPLGGCLYDFDWKDPQVFSPAPQPASGGDGQYRVNPEQRLLRLEALVPPDAWRQGANTLGVAVVSRVPYVCTEVILEKLELHLRYVARQVEQR